MKKRAWKRLDCEHPNATTYARTEESHVSGQVSYEYTVLHLHCGRCGMLFSRETNVQQSFLGQEESF